MSQLPSEAFDLMQLCQEHLAGLTLVTDGEALARQTQVALAALLPGYATQVYWLATLSAAERPDAAALLRLRAGATVTDDALKSVAIPLQAAGELLGLLRFSPPTCSPAQKLSLHVLATVLGPIYLSLRHAPPTPLARRKAELRPALDQLRGTSAVESLLRAVCTLVQTALPCANVGCVLRYRDGEWLELAYALTGTHHGSVRSYWPADADLTGVVMRSGKSLVTDSYTDECVRRGILPLAALGPAPLYAWMCVPMHDHGFVFGAMISFSTLPGATLSPDDAALLIWLTEEVSRLIRSAQRYERAAEEVRRREALIRIARAINSSLDPEYVPTLIVQRAPDLFNAEESSLLLLDETTGELVCRYAGGHIGQRLLGHRLAPGKGVAGYVVSSGQATIVNNAQTDSRFDPTFDTTSGFNTRAILAVPLRNLNGVKGVIEILNQRDNAPFTEDDLDLLEALADHALIALENAHQFASVDQALSRRVHELDRSNDRLRKILRAANVLRAERQFDHLLPQIAAIVSESSGFRSTLIALVRREHVPAPYLERVAATGPAASGERLRPTRIALAHLETLLRPEFLHGSLTYLIERECEAYLNIWGHPEVNDLQQSDAIRPDGWHSGDTLFCLLCNSRGELIGLLGVDDPEDALRPSAAQIQILEILANQVAAAIENVQLYADQQGNLNRMVALNALGRAINTTLRSPQQIYELTARGMQEMSDARWATVYLGASGEDALTIPIHTGTQSANPAAAAQIAREAIITRRPVNQLPSPDGTNEAMISIPLLGSRQTIGAICVGYGEGLPTTAERETMILFASQAATAVASLRLLGEVREGRDQLASIMRSTHEGMLLVSDEAQVAVTNGAFITLTDSSTWATDSLTTDLAKLPVSLLLERWGATARFALGEFEQLCERVTTVAEGRELFVRGELNSSLHGARSLEWTVLRATREGNDTLSTSDTTQTHWPILLIVRDITATKETERLRTDLTNMMVHDLRSPLTSIITSIDMIFRGITGEFTGTQHEILSIAYTSAQNLLNMVNLLLDISRLEDGGMPLDCTTLAVADLVERASSRMSVIARNKNVAIEVTVSPEVDTVYADRELVLRVLQNLFDNALKFSPKDGHIQLSVATIAANSVQPATPDATREPASSDMVVRFAVRDTGLGIKPIDLDKIFHKFGQVGNRRNAGSGLGLTFCKLVTEAHGGQIWVESAPGSGSTFYFTLPTSVFEDTGEEPLSLSPQ